jgi:nucleotide-binding universal stress UspA family protein
MKKILVGLDGSPRQADVLIAATALAREQRAKLVLFHSIGVPSEPLPEDYLIPPAELGSVLEKRAHDAMIVAARKVDPSLIEGFLVELGIPWQSICRAALEQDVDLIVIGSHGYGGIDRLIGTTAAKVVNHADRSVLVVRPKRPYQTRS